MRSQERRLIPRTHYAGLYTRMDMKLSIVLTNYGDLLRRYRTLFQRYYSNTAIRKYDSVIGNAVGIMLKRLKSSPEKFFDHARL